MQKQPKEQRRAIVTGGSGYIGSHLAEELVRSAEWSVEVVDIRDPAPALKGVTYHKADIRDTERMTKIFLGADAVFHLAALASVPYSIDHPVETHDTNVNGTFSVLRAAHAGKVKRLVYSASSAAYGEQPVLPHVETMATSPVHPYGLQKLVGEEYARIYATIYGLPTVSLRYFNVYGGKMKADDPYSLVIGIFLKARHAGEPFPIMGDGEQSRDFTHIRDIVRANILAATKDGVGSGEVMNIGAGSPTSINRLAELIGGPVQHLPARVEAKHSRADWSRAKKLLGWEPTVSLEDGIAEILELQGLNN